MCLGLPVSLLESECVEDGLFGGAQWCINAGRQIFLLFQGAPSSAWQDLLDESRQTYSAYKAAYLKYIDHPEELADVVLDPLTDDPDVGFHFRTTSSSTQCTDQSRSRHGTQFERTT